MSIDIKIARVKDLIAEREKVDAELASLFGNAPIKERKRQACGKCGIEGHSARTCTSPDLIAQ